MKNYLIIALPVMIVVDTLIRNSIKKVISNLTEGQLFVVCPSCNYDNKDLVEKCTNCSYRKGDKLAVSSFKESPSGTGKKLPSVISKILKLGDQEDLLFHMKLFPHRSIIKNGIRQIRASFIITTKNIIFLDYFPSFHSTKGWREKDTIPLTDITSIEGKWKKFYLAKQPFLIIKTSSNDVFEIAFKKYSKYKEKIKDIADIINKANPKVDVKIDLSEPDNPWKIRLDW